MQAEVGKDAGEEERRGDGIKAWEFEHLSESSGTQQHHHSVIEQAATGGRILNLNLGH